MFLALSLVLGLLVGSYLANVVYRLHKGKQYVSGRSECPQCKHQLKPVDLVPVLSWVMLRGRCRYCSKKISPEYPLIELATGILFAVSYLALMPDTAIELTQFIVWLYVLSSLIVLAVYDLKWYLLPDKVLLPLIAPSLILILLGVLQNPSWQILLGPILASILFGGAFYAIAAVSNGKWMGGGDIKLSFVMGLLLGLQKTALAMFIAFNAAAVISVALIMLGRVKRNSLIPFGPFLIAGTILAYLWGGVVLDWYIDSSGLDLMLQ